MNAYMMYVSHVRSQVAYANPNFTVREVISKVGADWRAMSEEERQPYVDMAALDRAESVAAWEQWYNEKSEFIRKPPKRSINAYLMFLREQRPKVIRNNPDMCVRDVISFAANLWRQLSLVEKEPYEEMARRDKERYAKERKQYVQADSVKILKRRTKLPNVLKVKRACPAYIFFTKERRGAIREAHPQWKLQDISKELGRLWHTLTPEERLPYKRLHEEDKHRYAREAAEAELCTSLMSQSTKDEYAHFALQDTEPLTDTLKPVTTQESEGHERVDPVTECGMQDYTGRVHYPHRATIASSVARAGADTHESIMMHSKYATAVDGTLDLEQSFSTGPPPLAELEDVIPDIFLP